jgi:hypothetical protein
MFKSALHKPYQLLSLKHSAMTWPTERPSCLSCMSYNNPLERKEESPNGNDPDKAI